jgi:anti-anti-sigma factor
MNGTADFVHVASNDGVARVTVEGEIDIASADGLREALENIDATRIEVDLSMVSFMDTSGLNALLAMSRRCEEAHRALAVVATSEQVGRLFEVSGVRDLLCR